MPIAGVVIYTKTEHTQDIIKKLDAMDRVTTYGVHKGNIIIAVFEGDTSKELEQLTDNISKNITGVLGIYPAYVNFELDEGSPEGDASLN